MFLWQIMEETGRCVSMSVPNSPVLLAAKYWKFDDGNSPELRQLARDIIRWDCRPYPTMQPQPLGYFVKLRAHCIVLYPMLKDLFPSSRCLFMYRDIVSGAKSMYRMSMVLPHLRLVYLLGRFTSRVSKKILYSLGSDRPDLCMRFDNDIMPGVLLSSLVTSSYLDLRRRGFQISAVRYEDLVARPLDMCRVILEFCRARLTSWARRQRGFAADSQRNCVVAKAAISNFKNPELTPQIKTKAKKRVAGEVWNAADRWGGRRRRNTFLFSISLKVLLIL